MSIPERRWTPITDAWRDPAGGDGWTIDIHYGPLHVRPISGESDPSGGRAR